MTRFALALICALTVLVSVGQAAIAADTARNGRSGCAELDGYTTTLGLRLIGALSVDDIALLEDVEAMDGDAILAMTSPQLLALAAVFDLIATEMDGMTVDGDVPAVARDYHEAQRDQVATIGQMVRSMATMGVFGALPYVDQIEALEHDLAVAERAGERACGDAWTDAFGPVDGTDDSGAVL